MRPGESIEVIPDCLVVSIELNRETFFSDFTMIRESPVSEPVFFVSTLLLDYINDPGGVLGPKSEMRYEDGNRSLWLNGRVGPT